MKNQIVAVMGTGSIGMRHLQSLHAAGLKNSIAVPVRASRLMELRRHGFQTAENLAAASKLGAKACVIATDTGRHLRDALTALDLGLDILVEKPLANDAAQAREIAQAASKRRRKAYVACVLRFSESLNQFRKLLDKPGRLHAVAVECRSYLPDWRPGRRYKESYSARASEGGVLRDLIHEVDYAGWLFGWPKAVSARLKNLGRLGIRSEEMAELQWEAPQGYRVNVNLDYLTRPTLRLVRAFGERGSLTWDWNSSSVIWAPANQRESRMTPEQSREKLYLAQTKAFLAALQGRKGQRLAGLKDGIRALSICDAARRAGRSRREEKIQ
ncbi:MAG: hypothetical protein A3J74_03645 [Elusimicrobia bacterium RIFCSPHIGHO2_02_FULL_57_9]|nr:MAG: hypothetical protein A3J74_03645 [Elusimicrobia bacterium RIFCSPHIGHO2_02_FULL_57_9]